MKNTFGICKYHGDAKARHDRKVVSRRNAAESRVFTNAFCSDRADVSRLQALGAVSDFELYALVFSERSEAFTFDFAEMREKIVASLLGGDETKTFGVVEPFYGSDLSTHLCSCERSRIT